MTATRRKTTARAALLTLRIAAISGLALLFGAPEASAAATYQAVGTAVLLQTSALPTGNVVARIGAVRAPRDHVAADPDVILVHGLLSSPVALPPLHPRARRRYQATTVASLADSSRPRIEVGPSAIVKHRETPAVTPPVRAAAVDVPTTTVRDAYDTASSRRGPPACAGRRTA